jgi:hypothetical protein
VEVSGPRVFQALAVVQGLKACKIGLRLNRAYTPTNCLRTASLFTGKKYPRGKAALDSAIVDLNVWIDRARAELTGQPADA